MFEEPAAQSSPPVDADEPAKAFGDGTTGRGRQTSKKASSVKYLLSNKPKYGQQPQYQQYCESDDRQPRMGVCWAFGDETVVPPYDRRRRYPEKPISYNRRMLTLILGHVTSIIIMVTVILLLVMAGLSFLAWKVMIFTGSPLTATNTPNCQSTLTAPLNPADAVDCYDLLLSGNVKSGIYEIKPNKHVNNTKVYCDMDTDGGGWTVLLRRMDNSENFLRRWDDYRNGFGKLEGEFWAGNELTHQMTSGERDYIFRVDMTRFNGMSHYAEYSEFYLAPESDFYRLYVSGYSGTAGDSFQYHNACRFSTLEIDNDFSRGHCARLSGAPWWFRNCHHVFLTGPYGAYPTVDKGRGISWRLPWASRVYLKFVEMKIRPKNITSVCL